MAGFWKPVQFQERIFSFARPDKKIGGILGLENHRAKVGILERLGDIQAGASQKLFDGGFLPVRLSIDNDIVKAMNKAVQAEFRLSSRTTSISLRRYSSLFLKSL